MATVDAQHGTDLIVTNGEATVVTAAKLMREHDVNAVAVLDGSRADSRKCVGLVTERDIVTEVTALELDPGTITVGDLVGNGLAGHTAGSRLRQIFYSLQASGVRQVRLARNGEVTGELRVEELLVALDES